MTGLDNRLNKCFAEQSEKLLAIYFTAGYPNLHDTKPILEALAASRADIIEIGMPFSDPIADGETIQQSNQQALDNGMQLSLLFEQIRDLRPLVSQPVLLMGYLNPVWQFGLEKFCQKAAEVGVDGLILPDLPIQEYERSYKAIFERYNLSNVFLITPQTNEARIRQIDALSNGFIYMVSSASTTGKSLSIAAEQEAYFERIEKMNLKNPRMIGFGIADATSFARASRYAEGAIIGSAFIKMLAQAQNLETSIIEFIDNIKS